MRKFIPLIFSILISCFDTQATTINATAANYTTYLPTLVPGDTLKLAPGTYVNNLTLNNINGSVANPIVIMGSGISTNFQGQSCCNTVSITKCSYLVIRNFQLDGQNQNVDAVKGEGTVGNFAHHITLEFLNIINYGPSQQNVGISTKCSAWDWVIRKNRIVGAGTGLYLGNSTGEAPFVNGIIEYNYVAKTIGYNMEIKHQLDTVRDNFAGTSVNGKTIIRHNVFTKDTSSSTGANARPNLLVGGFPLTGFGSTDYYEIYGNFFYNNPVEALFQGTGNIMMYENIFVNHYDPTGFRTVYFTPQNGVSPQDIKVFHNTVWANVSSGGIRLNGPAAGYQQYCYANAVFAPNAISNFVNSVDNITDNYSNASTYVLSATPNINTLNLYPQTAQLVGSLTPSTIFQSNTAWDKDFNHDAYNWTYRGAYSGCCVNNGWQLQLDTMSNATQTPNTIPILSTLEKILLFPNPVKDWLEVQMANPTDYSISVYDVLGNTLQINSPNTSNTKIDFSSKQKGIYFIQITNGKTVEFHKVIKE